MSTVEIEQSKFPLSAWIEALKRIRAKLLGEEPSSPAATTPAQASGNNRKTRR